MNINHEDARASALSELAPIMSEMQLTNCLESTFDMIDEKQHIRVSCAFAPYLDGTLDKFVKRAITPQNKSDVRLAKVLFRGLAEAVLCEAVNFEEAISKRTHQNTPGTAFLENMPTMIRESTLVELVNLTAGGDIPLRSVQRKQSFVHLVALCGRILPGSLFISYNRLLQSLEDTEARLLALGAAAAYRPATEADRFARLIAELNDLNNVDLRSSILAILAPYIRNDLFNVARATNISFDENTDSGTTAALVCVLEETARNELLGRSLERAQTLSDNQLRVKTLSNLAPCFSPELLQRALNSAMIIGDENYYATALLALSAHFSKEECSKILIEALAAAGSTRDSRDRFNALLKVANRLSEDLQLRALEEALKCVTFLSTETDQINALMSMLPLTPPDLLGKLHATARAMRPNATTALLLWQVARISTEPDRSKIMGEAFNAIRADFVKSRQLYALNELAPDLPKSLMEDALDFLEKTKDRSTTIPTLILLAKNLPISLVERTVLFARHLDHTHQAQILTALACGAPKTFVQEAITAALEVKDAIRRFSLLMSLMPLTTEQGKNEIAHRALQTAKEILLVGHYPLEFEELAVEFDSKNIQQMLADVLGDIQHAFNIETATKLICKIARFLPTSALSKELILIRKIEDQNLRSEALLTIAQHFRPPEGDDLIREAFETAKFIYDDNKRANRLLELAKLLPPASLVDVIAAAEKIRDLDVRASTACALAEMADEFRRPIAFQAALRAIQGLSDGWKRLEFLAKLSTIVPDSFLLNFTRAVGTLPSIDITAETEPKPNPGVGPVGAQIAMYSILGEAVRSGVANLSRVEFRMLRELVGDSKIRLRRADLFDQTPNIIAVIARVEGLEGARAALRAVRDTTAWFP
jgi:hypothetical protein